MCSIRVFSSLLICVQETRRNWYRGQVREYCYIWFGKVLEKSRCLNGTNLVIFLCQIKALSVLYRGMSLVYWSMFKKPGEMGTEGRLQYYSIWLGKVLENTPCLNGTNLVIFSYQIKHSVCSIRVCLQFTDLCSRNLEKSVQRAGNSTVIFCLEKFSKSPAA